MSVTEKKRLIRLLIYAVIVAAAIATALFVLSFFKGLVLCPFRAITGLSCPGCGNTRAFTALIHFHFAESIKYNYAYPIEFIYILYVLFSAAINYIKNGKFSYYPKKPIIDYILLILVIIWWVVRNILGI
ncbi:MAG: DUF2752 domain-containing protein [Ruminococcaceae bacterium]|nr:DUF2752 domain-containing protein [Oscillospiraceae bacterium]